MKNRLTELFLILQFLLTITEIQVIKIEVILNVQGFKSTDNQFCVKELATVTIQHEIDEVEKL